MAHGLAFGVENGEWPTLFRIWAFCKRNNSLSKAKPSYHMPERTKNFNTTDVLERFEVIEFAFPC